MRLSARASSELTSSILLRICLSFQGSALPAVWIGRSHGSSNHNTSQRSGAKTNLVCSTCFIRSFHSGGLWCVKGEHSHSHRAAARAPLAAQLFAPNHTMPCASRLQSLTLLPLPMTLFAPRRPGPLCQTDPCGAHGNCKVASYAPQYRSGGPC